MSEPRRSARRVRTFLRACALAAGFAALTAPWQPASAATTYVSGRSVSNTGARYEGLNAGLDVQTDLLSTTTGGGWLVLDKLLAGSHDRVTLSGGGLESFIGPTFFVGAGPTTIPEVLDLETASLSDWIDLVNDGSDNGDGTVDETLGTVFGEVHTVLGLPIAGATVDLRPSSGQLYYFNESGELDPTATSTSSTGRFLILNAIPGPAVATARVEGLAVGRAYGRIEQNTVSGLGPAGFMNVAGCAVDGTDSPGAGCSAADVGTALPGAEITWDFDPAVAATADADGSWSFADLPDGGIPVGLSISARGTAAGYMPALTFRRARGEVTDIRAIRVGFVPEAAFDSWQGAFGILQAPSLGMIYGRVRGADGSGAHGATVSVSPPSGIVRYFDAFGIPAPDLRQTSSSGLYVIFNVPVGNVTLSAIAPRQVIRSAVAPSAAGEVTTGDLLGAPLVTIEGRIQDETFKTSTITGAVVTVLEYPYLATVANGAGVFSFNALDGNQLPANEYVTLRIERTGFKISYSFSEIFSTDQICTNPDCTCPASNSSDYDPLCASGVQAYLISETGFLNLYLRGHAAPNSSRGLISAGVFLSNGVGAAGLVGGTSPASGTVRYYPQNGYSSSEISPIGSVQFFNAAPLTTGFVVSDPRSNEATFRPIRVFPNTVTLTGSFHLDCDPQSPGLVPRNIYPCGQARMTKKANNIIFQWDLGGFTKGKVEISATPTMSNCPPDATTSGKCIQSDFKDSSHPYWKAKQDTWDEIKSLGESGSPIYWRVLVEKKDADNNTVKITTVPFVFYLP